MPDHEDEKVEKKPYGLADDEPSPPARPIGPPAQPAPVEPAKDSSAEGVSRQPGTESSSDPVRPPAAIPGPDSIRPPEAIKLESVATVECPSCGAPMPGAEEVVCLRCGFDLSAARKIEVRTGVEEVEPDIPEEERNPILTPPGRGGLHLPAILAGGALLIMTIALLAGASGLYPTIDGRHLRSNPHTPIDVEVDFSEGHPGFGRAFMALLRFYVMTAAFAASALGGLYLLSRMQHRKIGDINLAALRCLAIVCVSELALLFDLNYRWGLAEWIVQFILMAGVFFAGARFFFKVNNQEAAEFGGVAMLLLALFVLVAEVIA